jgi:hypothetical protein
MALAPSRRSGRRRCALAVMVAGRLVGLWAGFAGLEAFHPRVWICAVSGRVGHAPVGGGSVGPVAGAGVVGERRLRGVVVVAVAVSPRADETGDAAEDALALLGAVDALDGEVRGDTRRGGLVVVGDDELFCLVGATTRPRMRRR